MDSMTITEGLKFATDYFEVNGYTIINVTEKVDRLQVLAKSSKTGKNETFFIEGGALKKQIHTKNKYRPWEIKVVARRIEKKSHIDAMRAAVNQDK